MYYIDIHTHKQNFNNEVFSILNINLLDNSQIIPAIQPFSIGVHPWETMKLRDLKLLDSIVNDFSLYSIGECGFDKNIKTTYHRQEEIFKKHVEISELLKKPLIIHCVGYFNELINLKESIKPSERWIIHGFCSNHLIGKRLIEKGFIISFGKFIFNENSKVADFFKIIPDNFFFLETDDEQRTIQDVYVKASKIRNINVEHLKTVMYNNFKDVFKQEL